MASRRPDRTEEVWRLVAERDPLLIAAAEDVDRTLIAWYLSLSPVERLDACSRAAAALFGLRHVQAEDR
jgi:hypothetical protein